MDQRDLAFEHAVIKARLFRRLGHAAHAGQHPHDRLHAAHFQHLFQLHPQVVHVEQTLLEAPRHAFGLLGLKRLAGLFNQRHDVAHAQDPARNAVGLKGFQRIHLFAHADKADGFAGDSAHRQSRTAATVTVHARQHHAGDTHLAVKFSCDVHSVLASQAIDNQQGFARVGNIANRLDFIHQHFVNMQAASRVQEQHIIAAKGRLGLGAFGDLHRRLTFDDGQAVDADLARQNRQLLHRRRAVGVKRGHQDALVIPLFQTLG